MNGNAVSIFELDPSEELRLETGKITYLTKSFGTVDEEVLFYIEENTFDWEVNVGDNVDYRIIEGTYKVGKHKYEYRCESIKKAVAKEDATQMDFFDAAFEESNVNGMNNVDSESELDCDDQRMEFEALQDTQPNKLFYDLPYGLFDVLTSKQLKAINKKLNSLVPRELNYKTYKKRFHALIHLEEVEMKISFEKYKCRSAWIEPENRRFSVCCSKICELRPPIAIGELKQIHFDVINLSSILMKQFS